MGGDVVSPRACPLCAGRSLADLGGVAHPPRPHIAGVPIDLGAVEFRLFGCHGCGFQFKDPPLPEAALRRCYEQAAADHWQETPDPRKRRFDEIAGLLEANAPGRRVLDVGCFNGAVLSFLGDRWQRFGVEPSGPAATLARQRGVEVLAATIADVRQGAGLFDAILAIDLVEHLADPLPFFRKAAALLVPQGVLVVGTGDTGSWPFRLQGSHYWYVSLPEHVSFFGEAALNRAGELAGLVPVEHRRLSHVRADPIHRGRQAIKNLSYAAARSTGGFGVPPLRRYVDARSAPGWLTARDHMLHVMRKPGGPPGPP